MDMFKALLGALIAVFTVLLTISIVFGIRERIHEEQEALLLRQINHNLAGFYPAHLHDGFDAGSVLAAETFRPIPPTILDHPADSNANANTSLTAAPANPLQPASSAPIQNQPQTAAAASPTPVVSPQASSPSTIQSATPASSPSTNQTAAQASSPSTSQNATQPAQLNATAPQIETPSVAGSELKLAAAANNAGTKVRSHHNDLLFNPLPGITPPILVDQIIKDRSFDVVIHRDPPSKHPPPRIGLLRKIVIKRAAVTK